MELRLPLEMSPGREAAGRAVFGTWGKKKTPVSHLYYVSLVPAFWKPKDKSVAEPLKVSPRQTFCFVLVVPGAPGAEKLSTVTFPRG